MSEQTALVHVGNPFVVLERMVEKGADPAALKQMMDLVERWKAGEAREAYFKAMSACQQEMPAILKDRENSHTRSKYAGYESLNHSIKPIYTKHGFSLSFGEESTDANGLKMYVDVRHVDGHSERTYATIPLDGQGIKGNANMTATQGKGSTISYGRRYLAKMVFNLAETDEDTDGNSPFSPLNDDQVKEINELFRECEELGAAVEMKRFYAWLKVSSMHEMTQEHFPRALSELNRKRRLAAKAKDGAK